MSGVNLQESYNVWRSGYAFALLLLLCFGTCLIIIGASLFSQGSLPNVILVGAGISMAPAAIVAALFRLFLFKEVQYQLTKPVIDEVKERLGPEINEQVNGLIEEYRNEISTLRDLRDAGLIRPFRRRGTALKYFTSAIDAETSEIMIVGSSLKGLLRTDKNKEVAEKLKFKIDRGGVSVKFLLTHPVVADLRAGQEARRFKEIGGEIIDTLQTLRDWKVPPENVRLYKGTPTCFAIKTGKSMFLNTYPYGAVAYDSPCLIIETKDDRTSYFYDEFDKSHFGSWDSNAAARIYNYDDCIRELRENLPNYANKVSEMLGLPKG